MAGDRGGTLLPGDAEVEGHVPRVHGGVGRGVNGGTLPDPAWDDLVASMGVHPAHPLYPSTGNPINPDSHRKETL